jgi:hypothetical protein
MPGSQSLFDTLAGGFGHGVDRPALESFVANSQSINGLRTAQTEEALNNAQKQQEEMQAHADLESSLAGVVGDDGKPLLAPSQAHLVANELKGHFGDAKNVMEALRQTQIAHNTGVESNPANLSTPAMTAAVAGNTDKLPETVAVPHEYAVPAGVTPPVVQQTPLGAAQTAQLNSGAALKDAQTAAGGFNPHSGAVQGLDPDHIGALQKAVADGRLDPARVNSRTAPIFSELELRNPGGVNFNRLSADAALQRNAGFQQKTIGLESLPTIMAHMTTLGKKIGYSDVRTVGNMQQWANGEFNDPDYTEYMTVRNDALMKIANLMRGVGMSDKAHEAEIQAAAPTLSPLALDGWLKGQMATLEPLLEKTRRVENLGGPAASTGTPPPAPSGATGPQKFDTEQQAAAANLPTGTRVIIGGVPGTWH